MQLSRHVSLCITMLDRGHNNIKGNCVDDINDYDDNSNSNGSYKNSNYNNNDDYDSNVSTNNDNNCSHDNDIDNDSNDARDFDWVGQTTAANIFWYFDKVIIRSLLADPASCFLGPQRNNNWLENKSIRSQVHRQKPPNVGMHSNW